MNIPVVRVLKLSGTAQMLGEGDISFTRASTLIITLL